MASSRRDAEAAVEGVLALAGRLGPCAQSRSLGLLAVLHLYRLELDEALQTASDGIARAGNCPYCLGHGHKIRGRIVFQLGGQWTQDLEKASELLIDRDRAGYASVLMVRAKAIETENRRLAVEHLMQAHEITACYEDGDFVCPSRTSSERAASYHRDTAMNLAIVLGNSVDDPACRALAREKLPSIRRRYRRTDYLYKGLVWCLEGQLELDACIAAGHFTRDGTWQEGKTAGRARDKVLSRYRHALNALCDAEAPAELAALLADIGAVDRDALGDVLLGDENVLRKRVEAVLATLPSEAASHTAELRAVLAGEPVKVPEVEELRAALYAAARAGVPSSLPAEIVERIEDVQESAAVVLTELDDVRPVPPGERFRRALVALRRCAESSGAPPAVVRLGLEAAA